VRFGLFGEHDAYHHSDLVTQTIRGTDRSARANVRIDISIAETAAALSAGSGRLGAVGEWSN
jgi:hypothetical protein